MKVQLQDQTLRLRIDEAELAQLLDGRAVGNRTAWPDGRIEQHQLVLGPAQDWQRTADGWRVTWSDADVRALASRLPSRDGLTFNLPLPGDAMLELLLDVDVRDSVRHRRAPKDGGA